MRRLKWIAPLLLLALGIVFLPQIASFPLISRSLVKWGASAIHMDFEVSRMHLSWFGPQRFDQLHLQVPELSASVEELEIDVPLWSLRKLSRLQGIEKIKGNAKAEGGLVRFELDPPVELSEITAQMHAESGAIDFKISANTSEQMNNGSFVIDGRWEKNLEIAPNFSIKADLKTIPSSLLAYFLMQKTSIEPETILQSLGPIASFKGNSQMQNGEGSVDAILSSTNASGEIHASFSRNSLILRAPFRASLDLTPQLSSSVLRRINPLFITAIKSEKSILLQIEPDGFSCPIFPLQLKNMEIGRGTLDLGKITCRNGSALSVIAGVLKNNPLANTKMMTVWFAPLSFSYKKGILYPQRLDALIAEKFPVCVFGTIDIVRDQLNMVLGLTEEALYQAFKIQGLSPNAVIGIPITGSTSNPQFSTGAAIARIAALMTAQSIPRGKFPGKVLKIFAQPDLQPPPPSSRPLPWER